MRSLGIGVREQTGISVTNVECVEWKQVRYTCTRHARTADVVVNGVATVNAARCNGLSRSPSGGQVGVIIRDY